METVHVTHVITGLSTGGAEMMLYKLLSKMNRQVFSADVISLTSPGPVGEMIEGLGIQVRSLGMRRGAVAPHLFLKLLRSLRPNEPDVVQTWMYHSDLLGGLAAHFSGSIPVVWGLHHENLDPGDNKTSTIWTAKLSAKLSRAVPSKIVCSSNRAFAVHQALGYATEKMLVIPNGFDLSAFNFVASARGQVRQELGMSAETPLIGMIGRFHPLKDHRNFIEAASVLHPHAPNVHYVLCGASVTWQNEPLVQWIKDAGLVDQFHLLGSRSDMPRVYSALDVATSSSRGESFPSVVGEAMACGIPCAVTDVGDSATIVGDTGRVVPPRDPRSLAAAWDELIKMGPEERTRLGLAARRRIQELFEIESITRRYEEVYLQVLDAKRSF